MPFTLYDSRGVPVAYSDDDEHIYTFPGQPVAYVHGDSVWSYAGAHLGRFDTGWLRDNAGNAAFFTEHATGGPLRPLKALKPLKGLRALKPLKGLRQLRPLAPLPTLSWSPLSGEMFFTG